MRIRRLFLGLCLAVLLLAIIPSCSLNDKSLITVMLPGDVSMELVRIPAGSFMMGSAETSKDHEPDEKPVHEVNIAYSFYMGKTELTQAQWLAVMGA